MVKRVEEIRYWCRGLTDALFRPGYQCPSFVGVPASTVVLPARMVPFEGQELTSGRLFRY